MKRFVPVLAAIMVLTLMPWGESFCDVHPQSYYDLFRPGGDDHPWGGEHYVEPGLSVASAPDPTTPITGIMLIDITLRVYLEHLSLGGDDGSARTVVYDKGLPGVEPRAVIESPDQPVATGGGTSK